MTGIFVSTFLLIGDFGSKVGEYEGLVEIGSNAGTFDGELKGADTGTDNCASDGLDVGVSAEGISVGMSVGK